MNPFATKQSGDYEALLASIVDCTDDAIYSSSLDGTITSWNRGAEKLFGFTKQETLGKHNSLFLPPDRFNEESQLLERLQKGEYIEHFETERLRKDHKLIYISLTISPLRNQQGSIIGYAKIARDYSKQRKSRETFKALLESAPDAMVIVRND